MASSKPSKGCYNCMKRRIICDRTEPHCLKCHKKGLNCPGMGIRYRFNDGIAARGKLRGRSYQPDLERENTESRTTTVKTPQRLTWVTTAIKGVAAENVEQGPLRTSTASPVESSHCRNSHVPTASFSDDDEHVEEVTELPRLTPCLELINAKTRYLFNHFVKHVSPVMLLSDGLSNGYRYHILPMAVADPILQRAVCVTSTFHLSTQRPELRLPAEAGRAAVIKKLKETSGTNQVFTINTWATIILLFVGELVTGSDDILALYRMLKSFLGARGATTDQSPFADFLDQQTKVIEFFTRPALSETEGIETLLATPTPETGDMDWPHPPVFVSRYYVEAYRQASAIYLLRAQSDFINLEDPLAIRLVAQLKDLLADVDPSSAGAHTLVWPYFVAAAESILPEHRTFFYERLNYLWETTRYRNVKVAMEALGPIWDRRGEERWTAMLPDIAMVIM